jgi:predicted ATPase
LVFFLDDLQWADNASLKWLNIIFNDNLLNNFLFIGAYRDNEITQGHPFMLFLEDLKKANITWNEIKLEPLTEENISWMLSEILLYNNEETKELAGIIGTKTGGNPFFIHEFTKSLYDNEFIVFNNGWKCDIKKIKQAKITDNVVEFMAEKIIKLPENTQDIMKIASCAGINFYLDNVALVYGKSNEETLEALKPAINDGMIIKIENGIKFAHDRVREAVYGLLEDKERIRYHYELGRTLLKNTTDEQFEVRIFNIVHQLNLAVSIITDEEERINLANLNLKAGIKAKASTVDSRAFLSRFPGLK